MSDIHPDLAGGRLTINLGALVRNWQKLAKLAEPAECGAVVKANAYGCGIEQVVPALWGAGCRTFFVAVTSEGQRVKAVAPEATCYVLNGAYESALPHIHDAGLLPVLGSMPEIENWAALAKDKGQALPCALQMDTGMNRLGVTLAELEQTVGNSALMNALDVRLFMTHYACADDIGHPQTLAQRERFAQASALLPGVPRSAANSAADLQAADHAFELARPGIALYGGEALNDVDNPMEPVATLKGRIIQIRTAQPGDAVGYGATETITRPSRLAYVSVGYADGYHRAASHMGVPMRAVAPPVEAAYKGQRIKGVGRISMDMCCFDVTDIPENAIAAGDWIELFGPTIPMDDAARAAGTIGYEMLTGLGHRYSRKYLNS
ncbi:MAG: alanine racemase [Pseudomonadota bacterium]